MAEPLKLLSSKAPFEIVDELAQQYEESSQQLVTRTADGGVVVAERVKGGEPVDVVVLSSDVIDALLKMGHLVPGSRVDLAKSKVAVAVRRGAPHADISSEEAVKQAVLSAPTLSYSTGPSGRELEKLFGRWGILEELSGADRIKVPPPGIPVATLVADGTVALGFQQLSELINKPEIEIVGTLPPQIEIVTIFSGAIGQTSPRPDIARTLLDYMASSAATPVKRRHGMDGMQGA